jgi:hypothetical protein
MCSLHACQGGKEERYSYIDFDLPPTTGGVGRAWNETLRWILIWSALLASSLAI